MKNWELLTEEDILAIHKNQLSEYGGSGGIRDHGGVKAAVSRPEHIISYNPSADIFDIATAVFYSITVNRHPFVDGNKRVGFAACEITLMLNDYQPDVTFDDAYPTIMGATEGTVSEAEFSAWLRSSSSINKLLRRF